MKKVNKTKGMNLKTAFAFFKNEFYSENIYQVSFLISFLSTFLMMYSVSFIWKSLYASNPSVVTTSLEEMITYGVLGVALDAILHPWIGPQSYIQDQVRKGTIEMDLLKPMDFMYYMLSKNIGKILVRFIFRVLPSLVIAYFFFSFKINSLSQILLFLVSLVLSILVNFLMNFLIGLLSMVTMNIKNIYLGYNALLRFFSGQMVPLWLFPGFIGVLGNILPFRTIYSIPMSIYIGTYTGIDIAKALGVQLIWICILFIASRLFMKYVFKRLSVQGG